MKKLNVNYWPVIHKSALLTFHAVDPVAENQAEKYKPH